MTTKEQLEKLFEPAFISSIGIPKLRELILTLAMQGKLTEQLPSDTPVETLLAEIEEEREALIKAKKIRRQKELPEIAEEEIPFEIPKSWAWVRIGNIGNLFNGDSINASVRNNKYTNIEGTPYIATKDVGYGLDPIDYNNGVAIPDSDLSKFKTAPKNTVLICSEGGSAGKKCGLTDRTICFGNKLFALDEYGKISAKFLLYTYLTPYFQTMFSERLTGIIGGVSMGRFSTILITLPPIEEQQRIVEKLDQLMAHCDQLEKDLADKRALHERLIYSSEHHLLNADNEQAQTATWQFIERHFESLYQTESAVERLRGTLLQLAVMGKLLPQDPNDEPASKLLAKINKEKEQLIEEGKIRRQRPLPDIKPEEIPFEIPNTWKWALLDNLIIFGPQNGFSPKEVNYETNIKSLTLSATTQGYFQKKHYKYIDEEIESGSHLWLTKNDILVQRGNTLEYVGVSAIFDGPEKMFIYPDLMMKIQSSCFVEVKYLHAFMSCNASRDFLRKNATGTSGTMPKINQTTLRSLPIALAPLNEQKRIVEKLDQLMELCDQLEAKIKQREQIKGELTDSLMATLT